MDLSTIKHRALRRIVELGMLDFENKRPDESAWLASLVMDLEGAEKDRVAQLRETLLLKEETIEKLEHANADLLGAITVECDDLRTQLMEVTEERNLLRDQLSLVGQSDAPEVCPVCNGLVVGRHGLGWCGVAKEPARRDDEDT